MFRRILPFAALLLIGCSGTEASAIAGIWSATTFTYTESGKQPADVLAQGGGLTITITTSNLTTGSLSIPATITGGASVVESMLGIAIVSGSTVEFDQPADTFVRDATWTIVGNTLVTNSTVAGVTLNITLTRPQF